MSEKVSLKLGVNNSNLASDLAKANMLHKQHLDKMAAENEKAANKEKVRRDKAVEDEKQAIQTLSAAEQRRIEKASAAWRKDYAEREKRWRDIHAMRKRMAELDAEIENEEWERMNKRGVRARIDERDRLRAEELFFGKKTEAARKSDDAIRQSGLAALEPARKNLQLIYQLSAGYISLRAGAMALVAIHRQNLQVMKELSDEAERIQKALANASKDPKQIPAELAAQAKALTNVTREQGGEILTAANDAGGTYVSNSDKFAIAQKFSDLVGVEGVENVSELVKASAIFRQQLPGLGAGDEADLAVWMRSRAPGKFGEVTGAADFKRIFQDVAKKIGPAKAAALVATLKRGGVQAESIGGVMKQIDATTRDTELGPNATMEEWKRFNELQGMDAEGAIKWVLDPQNLEMLRKHGKIGMEAGGVLANTSYDMYVSEAKDAAQALAGDYAGDYVRSRASDPNFAQNVATQNQQAKASKVMSPEARALAAAQRTADEIIATKKKQWGSSGFGTSAWLGGALRETSRFLDGVVPGSHNLGENPLLDRELNAMWAGGFGDQASLDQVRAVYNQTLATERQIDAISKNTEAMQRVGTGPAQADIPPNGEAQGIMQ